MSNGSPPLETQQAGVTVRRDLPFVTCADGRRHCHAQLCGSAPVKIAHAVRRWEKQATKSVYKFGRITWQSCPKWSSVQAERQSAWVSDRYCLMKF